MMEIVAALLDPDGVFAGIVEIAVVATASSLS